MTKKFFQTTAVLAAVTMMSLAGSATANVWIDESFDGDVAAPFTQGDGLPTTAATIDRYNLETGISPHAPTTTTGPLFTHTGSVVTTKSFAGSSSYQLDPGESVAVADGYVGQGHGDWVFIQFAINVDPIPASAGNVGTFTYTTTIDSVVTDVTINANANGSGAVVLTAGVSQNSTPVAATGGITTVGTLNSVNDWLFVTMQLGVSAVPQSDKRDPNQASSTKASGAYFFASSSTASAVFPFAGGSSKNAGAWSLAANGSTTGKIYIDTLYWEAAREDPPSGPAGQSGQWLKDFATGVKADVSDWSLYN